MERFKKKPLKFSGKASVVRAAEMNCARKSFRQTLHSVQRNIEDEPEKVNKVGIPKATSRLDMLKKWQEEKHFKMKMENMSKKPAFKVGASLKPLLGAQGLQESKTESFSSKTLTPNRSISKALEASRKYPCSKLGEITHHKDKTAESEAKSSVKKSSVLSFKPQIARLQENKVKTIPSAASNIKAQSSVRIPSATNFKPQSSLGAKVPVSGIAKPLSFLPQRKPINQQNKPKPVSSLPTKNIKISNKPLHPEAEKPKGSSEELFTCHVSRIEPEKSFAPPNYEFRPPKIRNSWLDDDGPCAILSRVKKEMETKNRTSTPLKKQEPIESGTDTSITGESSIDKSTPLKKQEMESSVNTSVAGESVKKEYSTIPCSDSRFIESLINSSAAEVPESEREAALNSKSSDAENEEPLTEPVSSVKEETPVPITAGLEEKEPSPDILPEKENVPLMGTAPEKESSVKEETTDIASGLENKERVPAILPVKENVPLIREPCAEIMNKNGSAEEESLYESVFLPAEPAPEKSVRRVTRSLWRMDKPSLALISESPENSPDLMDTPKFRPRRNLLAEGFSPRRSMRLAKKSEKEENIFDVQACFLDSPSVEAATRMSMASNTYDFEKLHLEPKDGAMQSNGSTSANVPSSTYNRKVSLLYTPPRLRQSTRIKSLKEDLMSFSPNE